jgi:hypothetical protein
MNGYYQETEYEDEMMSFEEEEEYEPEDEWEAFIGTEFEEEFRRGAMPRRAAGRGSFHRPPSRAAQRRPGTRRPPSGRRPGPPGRRRRPRRGLFPIVPGAAIAPAHPGPGQ